MSWPDCGLEEFPDDAVERGGSFEVGGVAGIGDMHDTSAGYDAPNGIGGERWNLHVFVVRDE
jgi:hypothetical protein